MQVTGNDALTGFTAPKILWVREHEPEVYAQARLVLLPKDYVRLRLTGEAAMDKADGSGTLLFDLPVARLVEGVLDKLEIPAGWLPPTFEGPEITGRVNAAAAAETGLRGHAGGGGRGRPGRGRGGRGRGAAGRRRPDPRARRASSSRPRTRRSSSPRAGSTPSATPCPAAGTSWA